MAGRRKGRPDEQTAEQSKVTMLMITAPAHLFDSSRPVIAFHRLLFAPTQPRACGGMGVLVKEKFESERPPETQASFSLRNPDEVQMFLSKLVSHATAAAAKVTS